MKLTQRDKITLSILVILLTLFCGIWFIVRPAFKEVQSSKQEYNQLRSDYNEKQAQVEAKANIKNDVQSMYNECVSLADTFYDFQPPEKAQEEIFNLLLECKIDVTSVSITHAAKLFSPYVYVETGAVKVPLDDYVNINDEVDFVEQETVVPSETIGCYTFSIGFDHMTREKIFEFIEKLKTYEHETLVVTKLSFNVTEADSEGGCEGNVSLEMYYLNAPAAPKLD